MNDIVPYYNIILIWIESILPTVSFLLSYNNRSPVSRVPTILDDSIESSARDAHVGYAGYDTGNKLIYLMFL